VGSVKTSKCGIWVYKGYCGPMNARAAPEAQLVPRRSPTRVLTQPQLGAVSLALRTNGGLGPKRSHAVQQHVECFA
jgi:hypothetical protein